MPLHRVPNKLKAVKAMYVNYIAAVTPLCKYIEYMAFNPGGLTARRLSVLLALIKQWLEYKINFFDQKSSLEFALKPKVCGMVVICEHMNKSKPIRPSFFA